MTQQQPPSLVCINVYEISSFWRTLNDSFNLNAFHVGVEVFGVEYSFQYVMGSNACESESGIVKDVPRKARGYIFKQTIPLKETNMRLSEFLQLFEEFTSKWISSEYHFVRNNCVHFAEAFVNALLRSPQDDSSLFPQWLKDASGMATANVLFASVADAGWFAIKWWIDPKNSTV